MEKETLYRFFRGETTSDEQQCLMDWLDTDEEHRRTFDRERQMYNALLLFAPQKQVAFRRSVGSRRIIGYAAQIAAMLVLAVGIGWGYVSYREHSWEALTTRISAPEGQRVNLKLQDGTEVWLNSGAELEYPSLFAGDTRRVRLAGEAFFDVSHDADKPFVVETFACRVEVLGTRFNVNADVQHSCFSTTLLRGGVRVTSLEDSRQQVVLEPDEKAVLENGKLTLYRADDPNEYLWIKGLISISGLDFKEVMHRMEHCYGVRINLNIAQIPTLEAMGKLRISDGIEHALGILQRSCNFNYTYNHETNEITIY
ncbi:MAG: FecR domain-containing protein [Parabacteroides merdae]|jgi:transmembrane sensor|nr:FecR domain-containing protein [Parabacteroides merdae]